MDPKKIVESLLEAEISVRYVAILQGQQLVQKSRQGQKGASSSESDRYEELLVNPTILKAASQRGNIDCGGLDFLLIRYGNFFQYVRQIKDGHVSVCIAKEAVVFEVIDRIEALLKTTKLLST